MTTRFIFPVLFLLSLAPALRAQQAATRPSFNDSSATTRPEDRSWRFRRRFDRRDSSDTHSYGSSSTAGTPLLVTLVSSRNIFVKGNQRFVPSENTQAQTRHEDYDRPVANQLVLTGILLADNQKVAFLEDQQAYTVTEVRVGDKVAQGTITNMTFDDLEYKDAAGHTVTVNVGFNLAGGDVWGASESSTSGAPTTQKSTSLDRLPGESVIDWMKRRRAMELAH